MNAAVGDLLPARAAGAEIEPVPSRVSRSNTEE